MLVNADVFKMGRHAKGRQAKGRDITVLSLFNEPTASEKKRVSCVFIKHVIFHIKSVYTMVLLVYTIP